MSVERNQHSAQAKPPPFRGCEQMELADKPSHFRPGPSFRQGRNGQRASQREAEITELDRGIQRCDQTRDLCLADHASPVSSWIVKAATSRVQEESVAGGKLIHVTSAVGRKSHRLRCENPRERLSITHHEQIIAHYLDSSGQRVVGAVLPGVEC